MRRAGRALRSRPAPRALFLFFSRLAARFFLLRKSERVGEDQRGRRDAGEKPLHPVAHEHSSIELTLASQRDQRVTPASENSDTLHIISAIMSRDAHRIDAQTIDECG
ncbi:hypothetical protein [Terrarubrum flagellatum]|uniref:hypothetical protein n=1 Tax=Terrirubrum flagellatum TaxID=2895980 RepID=UPI00314564D8